MVRTLQQLMNGRTPRARYGLALLSVRQPWDVVSFTVRYTRGLELIQQIEHRRIGERQDLRHQTPVTCCFGSSQ